MTRREHEQLLRKQKLEKIQKMQKIQKIKKEKKRRKRIRLIKKVAMYLIFALVVFLTVKTYTVVKSYQYQKENEIMPAHGNMKKMDQTERENKSDYDKELDQTIMEELNLLKNKIPQVDHILQQIDQYPKELLELLVSNSETIDFVLDYPKDKKSYEISEDISLEDCNSTNNIPLFLQWDKRWGYCNYGDDMIALTGCGPTCLAMVAVGLTGDTTMNPGIIARHSEESGYLDTENGTSWELMTMGAVKLGLSSREIPLDESVIRNEVMEGRPVIASMRPGDFTTEGHFIVLCGYEDGDFIVNDPNSKSNSEKRWSYQTLQYQIKNLWSFSVKTKINYL